MSSLNNTDWQKTESERLYNELLDLSDKYFIKYIQVEENYDFADSYFGESINDDLDEETPNQEKVKILPFILRKEIWQFYSIFQKLIVQSEIDNFYWRYCPFKVYENHINIRKEKYLKDYIDTTPKDFFINELIDICEPNEEYAKQLKGLKYDFDEFNLLPVRTIIEGKIFPPTKFSSEKHPCFQGFNETIQKRKIEFLIGKLKSSNDRKEFEVKESSTNLSSIESKEENLHPRYFNKNGFSLFESLKERIVREKYNLADFSFIYRQMQKDGYIYANITEKVFRDWLLNTYNIEITEPLKTLNNCSTSHKTSSYSYLINRK